MSSLGFFDLWLEGMALMAPPVAHRIVIFSHSYVRRLGLHCHSQGCYNMGFPDWYDINLIGLLGATVQAFEAWAARIVALQPELIIVDISGNEMSNPNVVCAEVAVDLFLHLTKILDRTPHYCRP